MALVAAAAFCSAALARRSASLESESISSNAASSDRTSFLQSVLHRFRTENVMLRVPAEKKQNLLRQNATMHCMQGMPPLT